MKRIIFVLLSSFIVNSAINAQFLKEIDLSRLAEIDSQNDADFSKFGFSSEDVIPTKHTLEDYAVVADQGESSSCTGFAVSGAMSILYNIVNRSYEWNYKHLNRFDPFYIYCSLKDENDINCISGGGCDCGSLIHEALDLIISYGAKKKFLYPDLECSATLNKNILRSMTDYTGIYDIDEYANLFDYIEKNGKWSSSIDIQDVKLCIANSLPVIGGIGVNANDFSSLSPKNNLYSARKGMDGRHAIIIVGYDDNMYGGAFRVLNSYGYDWGDDGFFWMTYKDFMSQGDCAYVMLKDDWDPWRSNFSNKSFYKGPSSKDDTKTWEGPVNEDGFFHGRGIIMSENYKAIGSYKDGWRHGWWLWYDDFDVEDPWAGYMLFEDGKMIEEQEFGFSSTKITNNLANLHINNIDLKLSDKDVTIDHFPEDVVDQKNRYSKLK